MIFSDDANAGGLKKITPNHIIPLLNNVTAAWCLIPGIPGSRDPDSILVRDVSRDILNNPGISRFEFSSIEMCITDDFF